MNKNAYITPFNPRLYDNNYIFFPGFAQISLYLHINKPII